MPKVIHATDFTEAFLSRNADRFHEAFKAEATRMSTEMNKWMELQLKHDPDYASDSYEEDGVYDAIRKAKKYRQRIYNLNAKIQATLPKLSAAESGEDFRGYQEELNKMTDAQIAYFWRIYKIYSFVNGKAVFYVGTGAADFDPFAEYEYDPEKS